jgi:hypothetical protein
MDLKFTRVSSCVTERFQNLALLLLIRVTVLLTPTTLADDIYPQFVGFFFVFWIQTLRLLWHGTHIVFFSKKKRN